MHLMDLGKTLLGKALRRANKSRPEATVNECDLAVDEATHEDVVASANSLSELEDLVAPWMGPPVPANWPACNSDRK